MTTQPFLIFSMPRSMTAWASCFLTCGDTYCLHEQPMTPEQIAQFMEQSPFAYTGIANPNDMFRWREITDLLPNATLVYIRRRPEQAQRALARVAGVESRIMDKGFRALTDAAQEFIEACEPHIIEFSELQTAEGLVRLWQTVVPNLPLPATHAAKMFSLHIQQNPKLVAQSALLSMQI